MFKGRNERGSQKVAQDCVNREADTLPPDINNWLEKNVFTDKYMYYSKIGKKKYLGYCECGADDIELSSAKSGHYTICPKCNKKVRFKNEIYRNFNTERKFMLYSQRTSEGWMQRLFIVFREVSYGTETTPRIKIRISMDEEQRDHLSYNLDIHKFHRSTNYIMHTRDWVPGRAHKHGCMWDAWLTELSDLVIYSNNLTEVFSNSPFKYINLVNFSNNIKGNLFNWFDEFYKYPQLEYILKLKLYHVAVDFYRQNTYSSYNTIYKNGKDLKSICGLENKEDVRFARDNDLSSNQIQAYNFVKKWSIDKSLIFIAIEFMEKLIDRCDKNFQYSFISNEKLFKYYLTQKNYNIQNFISDYRDYISNAIYLEMDTNDTKIKKPHDLKCAHDVADTQARLKRDTEEMKKNNKVKREANKLYKKYKEIFNYSSENYALISPQNSNQIIKEGADLKHCVKNYIPSIARGTCVILFLREASNVNKAFCTVEVDPRNYNIVQCRGERNQAAPEDAIKWLNKVIEIIKKKQNFLQSNATDKKAV